MRTLKSHDMSFNIAQSGNASFNKRESYQPKHKHMVVEGYKLEEGSASITESRERPKYLAGKTESREKTKVVGRQDRKQEKDQSGWQASQKAEKRPKKRGCKPCRPTVVTLQMPGLWLWREDQSAVQHTDRHVCRISHTPLKGHGGV